MRKYSRPRAAIFVSIAVVLLLLILFLLAVCFNGFGPTQKESSDAIGAYYRSGYPVDGFIRATLPTAVAPLPAWCNLCSSINYSSFSIGTFESYSYEPTVLRWLGFPDINQDWVSYWVEPILPVSPSNTSFTFISNSSSGGGQNATANEPLSPVPEPNAWAMFTAGIVFVIWRIRR